MYKEVKEILQDQKIVRVTTVDERWYGKEVKDVKTGLPRYDYLPSSTWIADFYPKGVGFYKWLANTGWDEAEAIKEAAGNKGSKVHLGTQMLEEGKDVPIDLKLPNSETGIFEDLTFEEIECISSFKDVLSIIKPEVLATELTVFGDGYAGTLDCIWRVPQSIVINRTRIEAGIWIFDKKTSQSIWTSHIIQVSSYSHADIDYKSLGISDKEWAERRLGIIQMGHKRGQAGYKVTEIKDEFDMFLVAKKIWERENPNAKPKQRDYPLVIESPLKKEEKNEAAGKKKD